MLSQMQRNISTACFVITDTSGASPLLSSPGCVIASPSYKGYARGVVPVDEDYVYNWTRDAAITVSEVLHSAPALMPTAVAVQTLTDYVSFADACQKSTPGDIGRGKYDVQGGGVAWSSQSDGPALRVLTLLQGYSSLSPATQTLAQQVIARDLACLLGPSPSAEPADTTPANGHPWAVCTCNFAQLYYSLANAIATGTSVPTDPLALGFFAQIGISDPGALPPSNLVQALRAAGDRMLNAVVYHSDRLSLSEQFDQGTGYEKSVVDLTWSYGAFLSAVRTR